MAVKQLMNKLWIVIMSVVITFSFNVHAEDLSVTQEKLTEDLTILTAAHDSEKPFLEDILRRKNERLRDKIDESLKTETDEAKAKALIFGQIQLLEGLLKLSDTNIRELSKLSRSSNDEDKIKLELGVQRRILIMNTYYEQLSRTLKMATARSIDVSQRESAFESALLTRAEFLSNAILYLDTKKKEAEKRLVYVGGAEKEVITQDIIRYKERISMLVASLEAGIMLMTPMNIDVIEYKQLLLSVTGDINADVLDFDVALGLFEGWVLSFKVWAFDNTPSIIVKLTLFLGILYLTRMFSRIISKAVKKSVKHSKMDFSVLMQDFFVSIASKAVVFVGLLIALSQIGIELGPLLTGFGVAGVIIGFALQDTLSNFASGLMILIYRPYDVGDMVKVAGIQGTVKNMSLVSTSVQTIDNQRLVIPNNKIWGDVINNITAEKVRRVDMVFGIGYSDDIDKAKALFLDVLQSDERVLKTPEPMVKLHTLNESSVDFVVRPWVKTDDYWEVYWDVTETIKKRLDQEGISIPFPQRDVHIYKHE